MIKIHQKHFNESIIFEKVKPDKIRFDKQKCEIIDGNENKLTPFQIYPEKEVACKYPKLLFKTKYSDFLF